MALAVPVRFRPSADLVGANHEYNNRDTVSIDRHKSFFSTYLHDQGQRQQRAYEICLNRTHSPFHFAVFFPNFFL